MSRTSLRVLLLVLVGAFLIANGFFDWFRLAGFERDLSSNLVVQVFRWVCVVTGIFTTAWVIRAFLFMKTGRVAEFSEVQSVARGWSVIRYSVEGIDFEKAANLRRPIWLFGHAQNAVVYKPSNPKSSMIVYDWMLPWQKP